MVRRILRRTAPRWGVALADSGAVEARAEILEVVPVLLKRLPDMQWDETAEAARMRGWPFRSFRPQHVKFAPGTP